MLIFSRSLSLQAEARPFHTPYTHTMSIPAPLAELSTPSPAAPRSWRSQRSTYLTITLCLCSVFMVMGIGGVPPWVVWAIRLGVLLLIAVTIWSVRNDRRTHRRELQRHMVHRALAEERLRLARHLHDIISDGLGAITVRATVAHRLTDREGPEGERLEQARHALEDVSATSRQTVEQLRRMLEILHTPPTSLPHGETASTFAPPRDVTTILNSAQHSGLILDITDPSGYLMPSPTSPMHSGSTPKVHCKLPPPLVEALHCGLQNVARHAGPTRVALHIHEDDTTLTLHIRDSGPATGWVASAGAGAGLRHLALTLQAAGGTLEARPTSTGAFLLSASLPLPALSTPNPLKTPLS